MALNINDEPFEEDDFNADSDEGPPLEERIRELSANVISGLDEIKIEDAPNLRDRLETPEIDIPTFEASKNTPFTPAIEPPKVMEFPNASALPSSEANSRVDLADRLFARVMAPAPLPTAWPTLRDQ